MAGYIAFIGSDKKKRFYKEINDLIKDTMRSPIKVTGKSEPLKGDLSGCWSRRITDEHRLVYAIREKRLHILQCRFHYQ